MRLYVAAACSDQAPNAVLSPACRAITACICKAWAELHAQQRAQPGGIWEAAVVEERPFLLQGRSTITSRWVPSAQQWIMRHAGALRQLQLRDFPQESLHSRCFTLRGH